MERVPADSRVQVVSGGVHSFITNLNNATWTNTERITVAIHQITGLDNPFVVTNIFIREHEGADGFGKPLALPLTLNPSGLIARICR
jgi:hypothetical protein